MVYLYIYLGKYGIRVPKSPPEGYIHLKLNKGVYSPKTLDGEGLGSEDPAENVPFNFPGEKYHFFFGWSIVTGWKIH